MPVQRFKLTDEKHAFGQKQAKRNDIRKWGFSRKKRVLSVGQATQRKKSTIISSFEYEGAQCTNNTKMKQNTKEEGA